MNNLDNKKNLLSDVSTAAAKSLSKNKDLKVKFVDTDSEEYKISENLIYIDFFKDILEDAVRGKIDLACYKRRFISSRYHKKYLPKKNEQKRIYELIHYSYSTVIGLYSFPGSLKNITDFLKNHKSNFQIGSEEEKDFYIFLVEYFYNSKISNDNIKISFSNEEEKILLLLKKFFFNKQKFSFYANKFCLLPSNKTKKNDENEENQKLKNNNNKQEDNVSEQQKYSQDYKKKFKIKLNKVIESSQEKESSSINNNQSDLNYAKKVSENYKSFTKKFDLISNANKLAKSEELGELRKKLDNESPRHNYLVNKLAKKLEKKLISYQERFWKFDLEEGILDSSKLTRVIYNPSNNLSFKKETRNKSKNTVVTLLIDNSGSMRGRPIIVAANAAEIITKTLEKCGIKIEILGFTTREWKGGKSKIYWKENGKIDKPGRLNDLLHIVYKDSQKNWKNCYKNLGLLLKDGLLKENIDGEAIIWAYKRLILKEEKRKILIVVSDGAPVDDSTLSANNSNILEKHLTEVVRKIQSAKKIDLLAIGIGHDVSKYYDRAITIENVDKLAQVLLEELTELFTNKN